MSSERGGRGLRRSTAGKSSTRSALAVALTAAWTCAPQRPTWGTFAAAWLLFLSSWWLELPHPLYPLHRCRLGVILKITGGQKMHRSGCRTLSTLMNEARTVITVSISTTSTPNNTPLLCTSYSVRPNRRLTSASALLTSIFAFEIRPLIVDYSLYKQQNVPYQAHATPTTAL